MKNRNKEIKSYTLSIDIINAIEAYAKYSGNSLSQASENLIQNGLENLETAEKLNDKLVLEIKNIMANNKKNTDRLANLLISQTRTIGKIYGVMLTSSVRQGYIKEEELDKIFNSGIKKAINDLKLVERKDYE